MTRREEDGTMTTHTRKLLKFGLQLLAAAISAAITALGTTACMSAAGMI